MIRKIATRPPRVPENAEHVIDVWLWPSPVDATFINLEHDNGAEGSLTEDGLTLEARSPHEGGWEVNEYGSRTIRLEALRRALELYDAAYRCE